MDTTTAPQEAPTASARCEHRSPISPVLGCARYAGHDGAHWLTGQADKARAELDRLDIDTRSNPARPGGYIASEPEACTWSSFSGGFRHTADCAASR